MAVPARARAVLELGGADVNVFVNRYADDVWLTAIDAGGRQVVHVELDCLRAVALGALLQNAAMGL